MQLVLIACSFSFNSMRLLIGAGDVVVVAVVAVIVAVIVAVVVTFNDYFNH